MKTIQIAQPAIGEEEKAAVLEVLDSGWLTQGPKVAAFEKAFAEMHQVKHAIACTSCTTALHLILAAMDIGPGDEVIVPAFTWIATANAVLYCGAKPIFADVDPLTYNIDPGKIREKSPIKQKRLYRCTSSAFVLTWIAFQQLLQVYQLLGMLPVQPLQRTKKNQQVLWGWPQLFHFIHVNL